MDQKHNFKRPPSSHHPTIATTAAAITITTTHHTQNASTPIRSTDWALLPKSKGRANKCHLLPPAAKKQGAGA